MTVLKLYRTSPAAAGWLHGSSVSVALRTKERMLGCVTLHWSPLHSEFLVHTIPEPLSASLCRSVQVDCAAAACGGEKYKLYCSNQLIRVDVHTKLQSLFGIDLHRLHVNFFERSYLAALGLSGTLAVLASRSHKPASTSVS